MVTEAVDGARSVSVGVWVGVGSRDEPVEQAGVSHFLEHLLFKGTPARDAQRIAVAVDATGGDLNAYTAKEQTVFYLRMPARAAALGVELLADIVAEPLLRPEDVRTERDVILEELAATDDSPEDTVEELLWRSLFPDHPLGWDVVGTHDTVAAMQPGSVALLLRPLVPAGEPRRGRGRRRRPRRGPARRHGPPGRRGGPAGRRAAAPRSGPPETPLCPWRCSGGGPSRPTSPSAGARSATAATDRVALDVLEQILGGGPSSRLFQEVRERRALAYAVYAAATEFVDCGALAVYAGVAPGRAREALRVVDGLIEDLAADGISEEELAVAKGYLDGSLWLGLEDTPSRMGRLGWWELAEGRVPPLEEYLAQLEALEVADVSRVAARILAGPRVVAAVGPFDEAKLLG